MPRHTASQPDMLEAERRIAAENLSTEQHMAASAAWNAFLYLRAVAKRLNQPLESLTLADVITAVRETRIQR